MEKSNSILIDDMSGFLNEKSVSENNPDQIEAENLADQMLANTN